jgi:hypothetical protein
VGGQKLYRDKGKASPYRRQDGTAATYTYESAYCLPGHCTVDHHPSIAGIDMMISILDLE